VRRQVEDAQLTFPVVIDNGKRIWNDWGNSMWPSVYLIDKQGRIRYWWYGELDWQGAGGQKQMEQRIRELLGEPAS
jgi:peroxiredoxin